MSCEYNGYYSHCFCYPCRLRLLATIDAAFAKRIRNYDILLATFTGAPKNQRSLRLRKRIGRQLDRAYRNLLRYVKRMRYCEQSPSASVLPYDYCAPYTTRERADWLLRGIYMPHC